MTLYDELKARGLVAQVTDEREIADLINGGKATFYTGFDPTADSLTAGHSVALVTMSRLQRAGNTPLALIGGGTTMVGDPSGRTDMRKMLTQEQIAENGERFKTQMSLFLDFTSGAANAARLVNNADWLLSANYIELLREVGHCFSVNRMLDAECYKSRMKEGLTFLEFNYMIMQSYDFYKLYQNYDCVLQLGGDDQWSNILAGTDLIRRKLAKNAYGLTFTLLQDSHGVKMGKTAGNALWLDPARTSPYEFYQYWRDVEDADVIKCLKMLTFVPLDEINEMATWSGEQLNVAKTRLAREITALVHGKDAAELGTEIPTITFDTAELSITDLLVKVGFCTSKGDARRNIEQGGVFLNASAVSDVNQVVTLDSSGVMLRKGKKKFAKCVYSV
ncbi:MAG: tyrosine--tRNA ligase [Oscillospiraceae bacterium]|jgi:tyrosyl-tRNA synthetase|nr:tyrosine--tRNA ligase [Oscillospiraceae bacterium]